MPEESNYKLDRSLMANSIEGRVPFQDVKIIKKYFSIPLAAKVNLFNEKIFLKKIDIIPNYIKKRKKNWMAFPGINIYQELSKKFYRRGF